MDSVNEYVYVVAIDYHADCPSNVNLAEIDKIFKHKDDARCRRECLESQHLTDLSGNPVKVYIRKMRVIK